METKQVLRFQHVLKEILGQIKGPTQGLDEIAVENLPEALDQVQKGTERDLAIRQIELAFGKMQSIRLALERIQAGEYGTCQRCEGEISTKRLEAIPWAAYCIRCQEIADSGGQGSGREGFDSAA
jgi:DnaK suppressor protein